MKTKLLPVAVLVHALAGPGTSTPSVVVAKVAAATSAGTVVAALSTSPYGSVLVVGGKMDATPLAAAPLYEFSGDTGGTFGCTTRVAEGFDVAGGGVDNPLSCTGPESDFVAQASDDDWPALTTNGPPKAGPGAHQALLGSVYRPGIGHQVTYAGHPLYLFDSASSPFNPVGEDYLETVPPLPPWRGTWYLVSAQGGEPAPGPATIETEVLPDKRIVLAVLEFPNLIQAAVTAYSFSNDSPTQSACSGRCAIVWLPVLTTGAPKAAGAVAAKELGTLRRGDGTVQVTYAGKPLYVYSAEKFLPLPGFTSPRWTGTAGNGQGLAGPGGGTFSAVPAP
ncbi:MAG TPA: hypothetical protein VEJ84_12010 [Acidimicrobiales bacterium]|nr:hypothetical protein [Acidimicrobiales bacterium]